MNLIAGLEIGGTFSKAAIFDKKEKELTLIDKIEVNTKEPEETFQQLVDFLLSKGEIKSIGIGSFGPLNLNKNSNSYGSIISTPKIKY